MDVNVLWLQETCATKEIPLNKIPGEENYSDMMTKDLVSAKTEMSLQRMRITAMAGRPEKAAGLHLLDESSSPEWNVIRSQFKHKGGRHMAV